MKSTELWFIKLKVTANNLFSEYEGKEELPGHKNKAQDPAGNHIE